MTTRINAQRKSQRIEPSTQRATTIVGEMGLVSGVVVGISEEYKATWPELLAGLEVRLDPSYQETALVLSRALFEFVQEYYDSRGDLLDRFLNLPK